VLRNWTFTGDGRRTTSAPTTTAHVCTPGNPATSRSAERSSFGPDGLVILDVSDIRPSPNPQIRIISKLFWDDQGQEEQILPFSRTGART
jgi:hypothetical protein